MLIATEGSHLRRSSDTAENALVKGVTGTILRELRAPVRCEQAPGSIKCSRDENRRYLYKQQLAGERGGGEMKSDKERTATDLLRADYAQTTIPI